MYFGEVALEQALGAVLAHSETVPSGRLRKGMVLGNAEIGALRAAGVTHVTVARLSAGDVGEDAAAAALAAALMAQTNGLAGSGLAGSGFAGSGLVAGAAFTGRVNLNATGPGIVGLDAGVVNRLNLIDPAITLATLAPFQRVTAGTLVGTVKIISYGVDGAALRAACDLAGSACLRVLPVRRKTAGLVLTEVPGQDRKLTAKGRRAVEGRLQALGVQLVGVEVVAHDVAAVAAALGRLQGEVLLILTGSATSDLNDTAPAALRGAGGVVQRFGMPVDPGNLLFHGTLGAVPVIGLPGCARSPALNGADWVLERHVCGLGVSDADIAAMGVGGLLKEIASRPQLREPGM